MSNDNQAPQIDLAERIRQRIEHDVDEAFAWYSIVNADSLKVARGEQEEYRFTEDQYEEARKALIEYSIMKPKHAKRTSVLLPTFNVSFSPPTAPQLNKPETIEAEIVE